MDNENDYEITGVIKNPPSNTHLKFDFLLSLNTVGDDLNSWGWENFITYLKIAPNVDVIDFDKQIRNIENIYGATDTKNTYFLQPVKDIHFHSKLVGETETPGNLTNIYISSAICLLILLIACINFINLSTARATIRAKEVGVRKASGAQRSQLIKQFLSESFIITACAFLFSLLIAGLFLPLFNSLILKEFTYKDLFNPGIILLSVILTGFVGFLAGIYPAFYLSYFRTVEVLNAAVSRGKSGLLMRRILVVSQYVVSITLLIVTIIISRQVDFMKNTDLGFEKEEKVVLRLFLNEFNRDYKTVKNEFSEIPDVTAATISSGVPGYGISGWTTSIDRENDNKAQLGLYFLIDPDFIPQYKIELIAGRNFLIDKTTDIERAFILNESAVRSFGWETPEEAIGKYLKSRVCNGPVIGVVKNFHFEGLQSEIRPLLLSFVPRRFRFVTLTINTGNLNETMGIIDSKYEKLFPERPVEHYFIDSIFDRYYRQENRAVKIFSVFTFLGLFLACLGLFSLSSFIVQQRSKEISIRKVLGASVTNIIRLLTSEFSKLVLLASIISCPIGYYFADKWLQEFAFRTTLGAALFITLCISVLVLSVILVIFQSFKAASANPVKSLRNE